MSTLRRCPECLSPTLPVKELLFSDARCAACNSLVGAHRLFSAGFSALILIVTASSTAIVWAQLGFYAALVWFSCPVGALSYLKARFSPLERKRGPSVRRYEADA